MKGKSDVFAMSSWPRLSNRLTCAICGKRQIIWTASSMRASFVLVCSTLFVRCQMSAVQRNPKQCMLFEEVCGIECCVVFTRIWSNSQIFTVFMFVNSRYICKCPQYIGNKPLAPVFLLRVGWKLADVSIPRHRCYVSSHAICNWVLRLMWTYKLGSLHIYMWCPILKLHIYVVNWRIGCLEH